jgi:hypothetical protein
MVVKPSVLITVLMSFIFALFLATGFIGTRSSEANNFHNRDSIYVDQGCRFNAHHRWENGRLYAHTTPTPWSVAGYGCARVFVKVTYSVDGQVRTAYDYGYPLKDDIYAGVTLNWGRNKRLLSTKHCAKASNGWNPPGPSRCVTMY